MNITIDDINAKYGKEAEDKILADNEKKRQEQQMFEQEKLQAERQKEREESNLRKKAYAEQLAKSGAELEPAFEKLIKQCLSLNDDKLEEICWLETYDFIDDSPVESRTPRISKPISTREAILIKLGLQSIERPRVIALGGILRDSHYYDTIISNTDHLTERENVQATLYAQRKEELKNIASQLTDADLDESGSIGFRYNDYPFTPNTSIDSLLSDVYGQIPYEPSWTNEEIDKLGCVPNYSKGCWTPKKTFTIDITKRELIELGLDPELLGWRSLEKIQTETKIEIQPKDIILAEQKANMPKRIIDSVKNLFARLLSRENNGVEK